MTNRQRLAIEAFLLLVLGGGVLWAQAPRENTADKSNDSVPDVIRAREFQMVDKDGKVMAAMRVNPAFGGPVVQAREFHVVDEAGYVRAAMRLHGSEGGPDITFWSKDHKRTLAELSMNEEDRIALILSGPSGKHQITVMATDNGPTVNLADSDGKHLQLLMSVQEAGQAQILVNGKQLAPTDIAK